ncbi:hypothetical protein ILUMI_11682 [Ignelater luminosus]|uniref:Uncharacterized protein n=1 Tax=Ignelater luminosus TaxID=2038154 RepID=A0A8K0D013_IGNLU|nr:hypothetical protein ILUMI_11682 [Ignelater luminosus]
MFVNYFTIIIIVHYLHYSLEQECFLRDLFWGPSYYTKTRSSSASGHTKVEDNSYYLPQSLCDYSGESVKKRINPYKHVVKELSTNKKTFSSLYFRCATCLVIAQEINKTIENITVGETDPKIEILIIEKALKSLCQNFNIKGYKKKNLIMEATDSTSSTSKSLDNQRLLRLRKVCSSYVENINMPTLYNILLKKNTDTVEYFCRGDGVFRECLNFNLKTITTAEEEENQTSQNEQCVFKILYTL